MFVTFVVVVADDIVVGVLVKCVDECCFYCFP